MKVILCNINNFDYTQKIGLVNDDRITTIGWARLESLGNRIAALCGEYDVYDVKLIGTQSYVEKLVVPQIHEYSATHYGNREIKVEVING